MSSNLQVFSEKKWIMNAKKICIFFKFLTQIKDLAYDNASFFTALSTILIKGIPKRNLWRQ